MKITVKQSVQQICAPLIWKWLSDLQKYSWLQKLCKFWNKHKIFIYPYTLKRNVFFFVFLIKERLLSSKNIYQAIDLIDLIDRGLVKVIGFKLPEFFIMFYLVFLSLLIKIVVSIITSLLNMPFCFFAHQQFRQFRWV